MRSEIKDDKKDIKFVLNWKLSLAVVPTTVWSPGRSFVEYHLTCSVLNAELGQRMKQSHHHSQDSAADEALYARRTYVRVDCF